MQYGNRPTCSRMRPSKTLTFCLLSHRFRRAAVRFPVGVYTGRSSGSRDGRSLLPRFSSIPCCKSLTNRRHYTWTDWCVPRSASGITPAHILPAGVLRGQPMKLMYSRDVYTFGVSGLAVSELSVLLVTEIVCSAEIRIHRYAEGYCQSPKQPGLKPSRSHGASVMRETTHGTDSQSRDT